MNYDVHVTVLDADSPCAIITQWLKNKIVITIKYFQRHKYNIIHFNLKFLFL